MGPQLPIKFSSFAPTLSDRPAIVRANLVIWIFGAGSSAINIAGMTGKKRFVCVLPSREGVPNHQEMFQVFSRVFVLILSVSIVVGNGTQIIDWHALNDSPTEDESHVQLILYSRKFKGGTTDLSNMRKRLHTYVLIHGFNDNLKDSIMLPLLTKTYLDRERCNVIIVDWADHAKGPWFINAAKNTLAVGKEVAAWLDSSGLDPKRVTLVGFSMGAHVAGDVGQYAKRRVSRIVALDPAHFLFQSSPPEFRLDSTDADIVEVVHTSGGYVGEKDSLGTRDFFANGGTYPQPGCSPDPTGTCSHRRAYFYYNEALAHPDNNFRSHRCASYENFVKHKCKEKGKQVVLHLVNSNLDKSFTGNFFFITNPKEPFMKRNVTEAPPSPTENHRSTAVSLTTSSQRSTKLHPNSVSDKNKLTTPAKQPVLTDVHRLTTDKRHATTYRDKIRTTKNKISVPKSAVWPDLDYGPTEHHLPKFSTRQRFVVNLTNTEYTESD